MPARKPPSKPKAKKVTAKKGTMERAVAAMGKAKGHYYSASDLAEIVDAEPIKVTMAFNAHFARSNQTSTRDGEVWVKYKGRPLMRVRCDCGNSYLYTVPKIKAE